jgi:hypothetical protein
MRAYLEATKMPQGLIVVLTAARSEVVEDRPTRRDRDWAA